MRKRPREIISPSDQFDTQGNVPATGQRAALVGNADLVYTYSSGSWGVDTRANGPPDVLVGEAGVDRTIASLSATVDQFGHPAAGGQRATLGATTYTYTDTGDGLLWVIDEDDPDAPPDKLTTGSGVICGFVQPGDYLGSWIMTELRNVIRATGNRNYCYVFSESNGYGTGAQSGSVDWREDPWLFIRTLSLAKQMASLNWVPGEEHHGAPDIDVITYNGSLSTSIFNSIFRGDQTPGDDHYEAGAGRYPSKHRTATRRHRDRVVKIYALAGANGGTFNAFGTGLAENTFKSIGTAIVTTGQTLSDYAYPDPSPTAMPSPWPEEPDDPPPSGGNSTALSCYVFVVMGVVDWTWLYP